MAFFIPVLLNLSVAIGTHVAITPPQPPPPKERQKAADFTIITTSSILIYKVRRGLCNCRISADPALSSLSIPVGRTP